MMRSLRPRISRRRTRRSSASRSGRPIRIWGNAADGYPGIPGIGARTAAQLLNRYGQIEKFPANVLGEQRDLALLFKKLATLRTDAPLFKKVEKLRWHGATPGFAAWVKRIEAPRLLERCDRVKLRHA